MWQDADVRADRGRLLRVALVVLGLLLCGAGLALIWWGVYSVTQIGTCASGNQPFVSARPCPEGTELKMLAIVAGTFAGLAGMALYAFGRRGRGGGSTLGLATVMWALTFVGIAGACALAAFGPDALPDNDGARVAAIVLLVVFIPMGLIPLIVAIAASRSSRRGREARAEQAVPLDPRATATRAPAARAPLTTPIVPLAPVAGSGVRDPIGQLERLARLRADGTIDAAEFDRLKARILGTAP